MHRVQRTGPGRHRTELTAAIVYWVRNEFSGTAYGPVVQAGHVKRLEVYHQPTVTYLRQLPPPVELIGRSTELTDLRTLAEMKPLAIAVTGPRWAGKSTLALAFAHKIADRFADGQLWLDMADATVEDALAWALRSLGMPSANIPDSLAHRVSAYRSALADKRVLVLLDNVADPAAVELFTTSTGLVLATGCGTRQFPSSTMTLETGPLSHEDAVALLRREGPDAYWCGDDTDRLARLCGGLPLALIGVTKYLNAGRYSPRGLADMLSDGRLPMSALPANGTSLCDSLAVAYRRLPDAARLTFRRLGPFPGNTITHAVVHAVAGTDYGATEDVRQALIAQGLLIEAWRGGTTELPVPFRLAAKEFLAAEESGGDQVLDQILDHYLDEANSALSGWLGDHPPDTDEDVSEMIRRLARGFFLGEAENLMCLLERASTYRLDAAIGLAIPLIEYCTRQDLDGELCTVHDLTLNAVTGLAPDHRDAYALLLDLNQLYLRVARPKLAADCLLVAQTIACDAGDHQLEIEVGQLLLAAFKTRLADAHGTGDRDQIANSKVLLAGTHEDLGNLGLARDLLLEALAHYRTTGNTQDTAEVLSQLGGVSRGLGLLAESAQCLQESVRLLQQTDDREGLRFALYSVASTLEQLGLHTEASSALARADALPGDRP